VTRVTERQLSVGGLRADELESHFDSYSVPLNLRGGLTRYFFEAIRPGSFLVAVLENNLSETVRRASPESVAGIVGVVRFLDMEAPKDSWGSQAAVDAWLDAGQRELAR
jgi:hypothetical protein